MRRIYNTFILLLFISIMPVTLAYADTTTSANNELSEGSIKLKDLIASCSEIADSTPKKTVNPNIPGKIISINNKEYEIRYFIFEDTLGKLPTNMPFKEYVIKNNLGEMFSVNIHPLPKVHFESFDFRRFKLKDGVYFTMAIRAKE